MVNRIALDASFSKRARFDGTTPVNVLNGTMMVTNHITGGGSLLLFVQKVQGLAAEETYLAT